jgi:hypothetical protein
VNIHWSIGPSYLTYAIEQSNDSSIQLNAFKHVTPLSYGPKNSKRGVFHRVQPMALEFKPLPTNNLLGSQVLSTTQSTEKNAFLQNTRYIYTPITKHFAIKSKGKSVL